jgi:hypothetical protein
MSPSNGRKPATFLFNPFFYIAGAKALSLGLLAILLAGFTGALSKTHFDGVLDAHVGARAPLWHFLSEGIVDWLVMAAVLLIAGTILSKTAFRVIDLLGTQALARWPTIFLSLITLPTGFQRFGNSLVGQLSKPGTAFAFNFTDAVIFFGVVIATILLISWVVFLMYQSFSVSCNVRGGKAVGTFIAVLIIAEILSKIAIYSLASLA